MRMKTIMVLGRYLPGSSLFFINIIRLLRTRIKKKQRNDPVNDVITLTKVAENISWLLWDSLHKTAKIAKSSKASTSPPWSQTHLAISPFESSLPWKITGTVGHLDFSPSILMNHSALWWAAAKTNSHGTGSTQIASRITHGYSFRVFASDFISLGLSLLEGVFFLVLKFHFCTSFFLVLTLIKIIRSVIH